MYSIHFLSCKNAWKYPECQTGLTIVDDSKAAAHGQCHVEDWWWQAGIRCAVVWSIANWPGWTRKIPSPVFGSGKVMWSFCARRSTTKRSFLASPRTLTEPGLWRWRTPLWLENSNTPKLTGFSSWCARCTLLRPLWARPAAAEGIFVEPPALCIAPGRLKGHSLPACFMKSQQVGTGILQTGCNACCALRCVVIWQTRQARRKEFTSSRSSSLANLGSRICPNEQQQRTQERKPKVLAACSSRWVWCLQSYLLCWELKERDHKRETDVSWHQWTMACVYEIHAFTW